MYTNLRDNSVPRKPSGEYYWFSIHCMEVLVELYLIKATVFCGGATVLIRRAVGCLRFHLAG